MAASLGGPPFLESANSSPVENYINIWRFPSALRIRFVCQGYGHLGWKSGHLQSLLRHWWLCSFLHLLIHDLVILWVSGASWVNCCVWELSVGRKGHTYVISVQIAGLTLELTQSSIYSTPSKSLLQNLGWAETQRLSCRGSFFMRTNNRSTKYMTLATWPIFLFPTTPCHSSCPTSWQNF